MNDDTPLLQSLKDAIASSKFTSAEMRGFCIVPHNALLAGAAIGYALAMKEALKLAQEYDRRENTYTAKRVEIIPSFTFN